MKVVLDTNVLVSACWKPDGLEAGTVTLGLSGAYTICVSTPILAEYRDVLARKKLQGLADRAGTILSGIDRAAVFYDAAVPIDAARDEDDNRFLECAFSAGADYLVTGNLRHYPDHFGVTRIVNARRFLSDCFQGELAVLDRLQGG
jgi:putative PIN family toxin of toxin-antitoxin system